MRYEFSKAVQREALKRSGGQCEATGSVYGLEPGQRCFASLSLRGKEYDHYPIPATDEGSNTLDNCVVTCPVCHRFKTSTYDVPMQAKGKRIRDKHQGVTKSKKPWPSRPFNAPYTPNVRDVWADVSEEEAQT